MSKAVCSSRRKKESNKKVSVVLSVYGNIEDFNLTLGSILDQSFSDMEVIVVDDGNEHSEKIKLRNTCDQDIRVILVENLYNKGLTKCLIQGIELASGCYIARIDNGDIMVPKNRLELQVKELECNQGLSVVGGDIIVIDGLNGFVFQSDINKDIIHKVANNVSKELFYHVAVMFRKDAYQSVGGYNPCLKVGQDTDLWPKIVNEGNGINLPYVFAIAPMKRKSISVSKNNEQILGKIRSINSNKESYNVFVLFYLISLEVLKLLLPLRVRTFLRYIKNMKIIGYVPLRQRKSLSTMIDNFYNFRD